MISYIRDPQQTIATSMVKIIGIGGAGANILGRVALDGMEGAELLAANTDVRTLAGSFAGDKIQLGRNLTKGLGTGGDPELGQQAVLEAEADVRAALQGYRIVFICAGLGGGTGSGAAPVVTRIAREEGAFVVVFATMPFGFEGKRRREQAEASLNQLAVLSNALVTFDNDRMGELVVAKQGIHEAFSAADYMICESIKAVIRLVVRPGLINVGLDDLMSALRTNRSRCLFGSGIASGSDRAESALRNALASPLLDQGTLLKDAQTVLVHLCGGEDLTLFEIELLMQGLGKYVPEAAHILFGAAVDPSMGDQLSITLISALPENYLTSTQESGPAAVSENFIEKVDVEETVAPAGEMPLQAMALEKTENPDGYEEIPAPKSYEGSGFSFISSSVPPAAAEEVTEVVPTLATEKSPWEKPADEREEDAISLPDTSEKNLPSALFSPETEPAYEAPKLKLGVKSAGPQSELSFDSTPRGRFEGEAPNVHEGEDLDLPPFLRKRG